MPVQTPIIGSEYRFMEDGFSCKDWPDPIRYVDVLCAAVVPGSRYFDIDFKTPKGKKRRVSILLDRPGEEEAVQALLQTGIPAAASRTRVQTAWEAAGAWVTVGLCLAGLVGLIILLNTVGRGTSVTVPVWMIPFLFIGSLLSTGQLLLIAVLILAGFGIASALSLRKRKTVLVIEPRS